MSATPSNMIPLGTKAPHFSLEDTRSGKQLTLEEIKSDVATLVMFICNHCPYVKHVLPEIMRLDETYTPKGISLVAISSNDVVNYPEDSPAKMKLLADQLDFSFPYLYDETQEIARDYDAACTPDFYVFDGSLSCVYRGQLDDSRPGNGVSLSGRDVRNALDNLLADQPVSPDQKASMGCNIKWK